MTNDQKIAEISVLNHGFVALVDTMGDDRTPARTSRTSYRNKTERSADEDAKLTDYLVRNKHTTPLEFCQVRFYMKLPIFVARQLVRHRTASINEVSYRYVTAAREFYVPAEDRLQRKAENNKQGSSSQIVDDPKHCLAMIEAAGDFAFNFWPLRCSRAALASPRTLGASLTCTVGYAGDSARVHCGEDRRLQQGPGSSVAIDQTVD